ncbi:MAG TPA: uracil-DNA glycosylase family protein [Anaerolineae bacterium]
MTEERPFAGRPGPGAGRLLAELHAEMRACRLCAEAGYDMTAPPIFRGGPGARVMLIGQAPGVTEVEAQRPFNAGSGRRLFQWLGAAGWEEDDFRARHYMTAVNKCYPGKAANGKGDRVPSKAEQALCRPFLEREIALINPVLMLLVGGLAIKLLYPASARLKDIIGTAAYFPPEALADNPVNFNLKSAQVFKPTDDNLQSPIPNLESGRWVVPLPHPSGASLWPNKPENQESIGRAIDILREIRLNLEL